LPLKRLLCGKGATVIDRLAKGGEKCGSPKRLFRGVVFVLLQREMLIGREERNG